jgi:hypothetical protein
MWLVLPLPLHLVIIVDLACPVDSLSVGGPCCSLSPALPLKLMTGGGGGAILQERLPYVMSRRRRGMQALRKRARPAAVDINETFEEDNRGVHDGKDVEEDKRGSSSGRWVSGSGPPGCFVLLQGSFGPLAPPFPMHDH